MKKKEEKAIKILEIQRDKITDPAHYNDSTWVYQTASYSKEFFGEDSLEVKFWDRFSFSIWISSDMSKDQIRSSYDNVEQTAIKHINNCIDKINKIGLYEPAKKNFMSALENTTFISILVSSGIALISLGFFFGQQYSKNEVYDMKIEKDSYKDSLRIFRVASFSPNKSRTLHEIFRVRFVFKFLDKPRSSK